PPLGQGTTTRNSSAISRRSDAAPADAAAAEFQGTSVPSHDGDAPAEALHMDTGSISRRTALTGLGGVMAWPVVAPQARQAAPTRSLQGKIALVTGSGANLGRTTVLELARRGADVVVNARTSRDEAEAVAREAQAFGVRAIALMADVGNE